MTGLPNTQHRKYLRRLLPRIIERDGGQWVCHYCGCNLIPSKVREGTAPYYKLSTAIYHGELITEWEEADGFSRAIVEHKQPLSKGGTNDLSNLVASCYQCNKDKKEILYDEFVKGVSK